MASDQLWGSLVKAMTRKIEVPRAGSSDSVRALSPTDLHGGDDDEQTTRIPGGRRRKDPPPPSANESGIESREEAIQRIASHLGYLPHRVVEEYLGHHGGANGVVAERLQALGLVPSNAGGGANFWWSGVKEGWADPELMAEVLRSAPGMPQHRQVSGLLFDFLLDAEVAGYREVKAADQKALQEATRLLDVLVSDGSLTEARAADLACEFFGLRRRRGKKWSPDAAAVATVNKDLSDAFGVVPMAGGDEGATTLLVVDDPGPILLETLARMTGREVRLLIETPTRWAEAKAQWDQAVGKLRGRGASRRGGGKNTRRPKFRLDQDSFAGITYVPEMVVAILEQATQISATDVHLEPHEDRLRVRFRVDGILYDVTQLNRAMGDDVISRIKVMADMDITERRRPQDGHVHQELLGEPFDFRIATVPTSRGERMSIRITAASKEIPSIASLGLTDADQAKVVDFTKRSHGIVLACGPVGSGKTTTLYASLGEIDAHQKNIMTIEDPVEIELPDVSQVHVNYKSGLDFGAGLRALLRQDPNIIMVGEVRDEETAKVAVRSSLTGLLVFSTIHANSAPGAVTTLYNFNIPPFLLATSLVGVIAQRLVRTICLNCKHEATPDPAVVLQAGFGPEPEPEPEPVPEGQKPKRKRTKKAPAVVFHEGKGCDQCYGTGYSGRTAIFEILQVTEAMRHAITERAPEADIRSMAVEGGMATLVERGRALVESGDTTLQEFVRVLYQ